MKTIKTIFLLLLTNVVLGQTDVLHANRIQVLEEDNAFVAKCVEPIKIELSNTIIHLDSISLIASETNSIYLLDGERKLIYYLFDNKFIKGVAYFNEYDIFYKLVIVDVDGNWYSYFFKEIKI